MRTFPATSIVILVAVVSGFGTKLGLISYARGLQQPSSPTQQRPEKKSPQSEQKRPEEPAQNQEETIHLSSHLVLVPVSASDANGNPVTNLTARDIVIEEQGRPQQVVSLGEPGKTPIDLALLFDVSGSTMRQFDFERQAAEQFVKRDLKPGDDISIFAIGATPKMIQARTNAIADAIAGLNSIEPANVPTAFFDTVIAGVQYLGKTADAESRRVVLVISDGEENYSTTGTLSQSLRDLQKNDCLFYSINPNGHGVKLNKISQQGQAVMESMASETGGKAFSISRPEDLESVFNEIAAELQAQYLFGYYADDQATDTGFKKITVRAPGRPDIRIRARQGYYPSLQPAPKP